MTAMSWPPPAVWTRTVPPFFVLSAVFVSPVTGPARPTIVYVAALCYACTCWDNVCYGYVMFECWSCWTAVRVVGNIERIVVCDVVGLAI
jgi:hypothetical protein